MIIKKIVTQAKKNPEKIAVAIGNKKLSYKELDYFSRQCAVELNRLGIKKSSGDPEEKTKVSLLFEHGQDWITGIISVLRANQIYIPLDITYPHSRLLYMLENSETSIILTNRKNFSLADSLAKQMDREVHVSILEDICHANETVSDFSLEHEVPGDEPAYILYTSGSTGKPKGVLQSRKNLLYFIEEWIRIFSITEDHHLALLASFSHDGSIPDIFSALVSGATLFPYDIKERPDFGELIEWLKDEKINIWHSVPTLFRYFAGAVNTTDVFPDLRYIVLGGEEVRKDDVNRFISHFPGARFANIYGQTESTVNSIWIYSSDQPFSKVILGEPIGETEILLVDESGGVVEGLGTGEIVIASNNIALGYWRDKETSDKVFTSDTELGRLYWTGDRGRLTAGGDITFIGRKDNQVKIRGYRVETGEIESTILKQPGICEAAVISKKNDKDDYYLCAYYVSEQSVESAILTDLLAKELPDYMIPNYFFRIEKMPLTVSGKIDRNALPEMEPNLDLSIRDEEPLNEVEKTVVELWKDILGKDSIGARSNFFELGGHSLLIVTLISQLGQIFKVKLQLKDVFDNPTVRKLSKLVIQSQQKKVFSIESSEKKEYYEISSAQKRLLVLQQSKPKSVAYNIPGVYIWEGDLDIPRFESALQKLVQRHETLRTSFYMMEDESVQRIHRSVDFKIVSGKYSESQALEKLKTFRRPFDLSEPPLLRVELCQVQEKKFYICFDIHHVISDAYSMQLLVNDFAPLYEGKSLQPLTIQYRDFAIWQNRFLTLPEFTDQENYWLNKLEDFKFTRLPLDHFSSDDSEAGGQESYFIQKLTIEQMNVLAGKYGVTKFAFLISVFFIVLAREISQKDITIGIPSTHREHHHLRNIIGIFLNVLLIREKVDINDSFLTHLLKMKQTVLDALANQDYPYELLYAKIKEKVHFKGNDMFTVLFNYFPMDENEDILSGSFKISKYDQEEVSAKYDVTVYVMDMPHGIGLKLVYKKSIFSPDRIKRLLNHFLAGLQNVLMNENNKIIDLFNEKKLLKQESDDFTTEFDSFYEEDEMMPIGDE